MAAIVLGATTPTAVAGATGLDPKAVTKALYRLLRGGLVEATGAGGLRVTSERFKEAAQHAAAARPQPRPEDFGATADQAEVLRNYLVDGKLAQVPAQLQPLFIDGFNRAITISIANSIWLGVAAAAVALVFAFFLREIPLRTTNAAPAQGASRTTAPGRPAVSLD